MALLTADTWYTVTNTISGDTSYLSASESNDLLQINKTQSAYTNWQFFLSNRSVLTNLYWVRNQAIGSTFHIGISYRDGNVIPSLQSRALNESASWNIAFDGDTSGARVLNAGAGTYLDLTTAQVVSNSTDATGSIWTLQKNGLIDDSTFLISPLNTTIPLLSSNTISSTPLSITSTTTTSSNLTSRSLSSGAVAGIAASSALLLLIIILISLHLWHKHRSRPPRRFTMLGDDELSPKSPELGYEFQDRSSSRRPSATYSIPHPTEKSNEIETRHPIRSSSHQSALFSTSTIPPVNSSLLSSLTPIPAISPAHRLTLSSSSPVLHHHSVSVQTPTPTYSLASAGLARAKTQRYGDHGPGVGLGRVVGVDREGEMEGEGEGHGKRESFRGARSKWGVGGGGGEEGKKGLVVKEEEGEGRF